MKNTMLAKVFFAIVLAILAGLFSGTTIEILGIKFIEIFGLIGQLFLNALSLVVVPLVSSSIIIGTARIGSDHSFGSLGAKTFGYFVLTTLSAIIIGIIFAIFIAPGVSEHAVSSHLASIDSNRLAEIAKQAGENPFHKIESIVLKLVPANILAAASQGQMLGLIVFCMLFGFFISKIDSHASSILLGFWKGIFQVMMKITHLVMKALPIGVFGLVAKAIALTGVDSVGSLALFFGTVCLGLSVYALVFLPLLLKICARVSPIDHIKAMLPALVTAFSTSSSSATLPVTFECVEKKAGISNRISSFILPLGTSVTSGSALYVCVGVIFIAQSYGIDLGPLQLALILLMTLLTTFGTAGIPSGSIISVVMILHTLGLPGDGIGMIMAVERLLDMFRTSVNVFGTSCCAVLVARSEGEQTLLSPAKSPKVAHE